MGTPNPKTAKTITPLQLNNKTHLNHSKTMKKQSNPLSKDHPSRLIIRAALRVLERVKRLKLLMTDRREAQRNGTLTAAVFRLQLAQARLRQLKANERERFAKDKLRRSPTEVNQRYNTVCYGKTK